MVEGLLWFDNDPRRKLSDKVRQAATRYQVKFGQRPTACYLNAADLDRQIKEVNGVQLYAVSNVLRYHFWIGVETEAKMARAA